MAKAKYWTSLLYPENMIPDWKEKIDDLLEIPFVYCVHDKDLDNDADDRKVHVHIILAFSNTTTENNARNLLNRLSLPGKCCLAHKLEQVVNIRRMYDYIIHATDKAIKDCKYHYDKSERITGNNFDIGSYEQFSTAEKLDECQRLYRLIRAKNYFNFVDFLDDALLLSENPSLTFESVKSNSGFFERCIKGNYVKSYSRSHSSTTTEE